MNPWGSGGRLERLPFLVGLIPCGAAGVGTVSVPVPAVDRLGIFAC